VVNFRIPPQPTSTLSAAATLEAPQESDLDTRRIPELPGDHAGAVPDRVLVGAAAPKADVPTEAINWLTTHAAKSGAHCVGGFAVRRGWRPAGGATRSYGPRAAKSSRWALGCEPQVLASGDRLELDEHSSMTRLQGGVGGTKGRARARASTTRGKIEGNALLRRRADRQFLSALSSCHPDIVRPPAAGASCDQDVNHLSPTPLFDGAKW